MPRPGRDGGRCGRRASRVPHRGTRRAAPRRHRAGVDSLGLVYASYFAAAALLSGPLWPRPNGSGYGVGAADRDGVYVAALLGIATMARSSTACRCSRSRDGRSGDGAHAHRVERPGRRQRRAGTTGRGVRAETLLDPDRDAARRPVGPAIALTIGWRWAYAAAAVLALIVACWPSRDLGWTAGAEARSRAGHVDGGC